MAQLTKKQALFVQEYLIDLNATQSYKRAGYSVNSDAAAGVEGHKLLKNPKIQEAIEEAMKKRETRTAITQDRVLAEIAKMAFINPKAFFNSDGTLKNILDIDDNAIAGLAGSIDVFEEFEGYGDDKTLIGYTKKIKVADKLKALELLGRHLGMFKEKLEVSGNVNNPFTGFTTDELKQLIKK